MKLSLHAFNLQPVPGPAGSIGPIALLGDDAFEPDLTDMFKQLVPIGFHLFGKPDSAVAGWHHEVFQQVTTQRKLGASQVVSVEV